MTGFEKRSHPGVGHRHTHSRGFSCLEAYTLYLSVPVAQKRAADTEHSTCTTVRCSSVYFTRPRGFTK